MGSNDRRFPEDGEGPSRRVTLGPSPSPVTCWSSNLQFGDFVRATGYATDAERCGWSFVFEGQLADGIRQNIRSRAAETPWWIALPHAYWAPCGGHTGRPSCRIPEWLPIGPSRQALEAL